MKMLQAAHTGLLAKIANPDDPKLLPKSQKPKEAASPKIKDKHFKEKYASSSVPKHEREEREKEEAAIEKQNSINNENENENKDEKSNAKDSGDIDVAGNDDADGATGSSPKVEDTRTTEEIDKDNSDVKNALSGLDADDMDLLAQIQSSKDTTVLLSMSELAGKTKEEKVAIFKEKQKQFRKEKGQAARRAQIDKEQKRRENVKHAQEAKEKRKEQQLAMMARKKKREKEEEKLRKQRIREKIKKEKERKAKLKELEKQRKAAQNNPQ